MRVTSNTFPNTLVDQLGKLATRQNTLQNQAATGQRIQNPEDDPAAVRRVLDLQTEAKANYQYNENIAVLNEQATSSYESMSGLKTVLNRAREIAILADDLDSQAEMDVYANEVRLLVGQAVHLSNSQHRGDYLFGGTVTDQPPFTTTQDANGFYTGVAYQGNESVASSEIGKGMTISSMTLGSNTSGAGPRGLITDSRTGADLFAHLISLQDNLRNNNKAAITATDHPALGLDEENVLIHFGTVGSIMSQLETTKAITTKYAFSIEKSVSREADVDFAQVLVKLNQTQTAYQAALQSGSKILGQTLLDYLR